jgi:NAD(P)-dependent dehydrogenase (short-subunit alcohol dehydrogenase family)
VSVGGSPRVALVTGASSGFGRLIGERLAGEGWRVWGASRSGAAPPPVQSLSMDVTDEASVEAGVAAVIAREGRLDAVVSNAGIGVAGAIEDTSTAEALAQFETNFFGNHRLCRAALPHLRARPRAHIVVVGSLAGLVSLPFQGFYSASKFALEGYCEALRLELRRTGVRVAIVQPGDFQTGFTAQRRRAAASGAASPYAAAFERALAIIEEDETGGEDPARVAEAVCAILATDDPPLRHVVAAPDQAGLAEAKASMAPGAFEAAIAEHYLPD